MKLTKQQAQQHAKAVRLVALDRDLTEDEREFVLDHWQEAVTARNALDGAFPGPAAAPDAADLAAAPPGAPVRLLTIAAELGIGHGGLDEAVYEAANEVAADAYNNGAHPALDGDRAHRAVHAEADHRASTINNEGLAAQLAYLYEGCASEAAFRSLLRDLRE